MRSMVETAEETAAAVADVDAFLDCGDGGYLKRVERAGIRRARSAGHIASNHDGNPILAESFSVRPFLLIAAALLAPPRRRADRPMQTGGGREGGREHVREQRVGILQMDVSGSARSVSIGLSTCGVEQTPRRVIA
jgi:hypothetical protein